MAHVCLAFCIFSNMIFAQFLVQSSGAFFGMFIFCILHLFSIFFVPHSGPSFLASLLAHVCMFFAQFLVQFSGASFGMFFCILHLFCIFSSFLIVGHHSWPHYWAHVCMFFCTIFGAIFWCLFWHGFLYFASFCNFFF